MEALSASTWRTMHRARAAVQAHKATFEFFEMALGEEDPTSDPYPPLPFCRNDHDTAARTAAARRAREAARAAGDDLHVDVGRHRQPSRMHGEHARAGGQVGRLDVQELLEDPKPFGEAIFAKQRPMSQVREYDANGYRVPTGSLNQP